MRHELRLADIGEGLDEAEIIEWRVSVGDRVARDQPVVEIMTDKSNAELPAPWEGTVVELAGTVGDIINVGDLIAIIDDAGAPHAATALDTTTHGAGRTTPPLMPVPVISDLDDDLGAGAPAGGDASESRGIARPKASPSTRRAALERGIDLAAVAGSGPGGRILLSDLDGSPSPGTTSREVTPTVEPRPTADPENVPREVPDGPESSSRTVALRGVRRVIARNMAQSWSQIPHIHAFQHIDAEPLLEFRDRLKKTGRPAFDHLTPLTIVIGAVASALRAHPEANASIDVDGDTITYHGSVNIGVAVASPQGLVVPVVHGADTLDLEALSVAVGELVGAARHGSLSTERMAGGTATITNFGSLGAEQATPLIRPPESVIIGFGSIQERPFVVDGAVIARKTVHLVIGADHRLLDGDVTTSVLRHVADVLLEPLSLFLGP